MTLTTIMNTLRSLFETAPEEGGIESLEIRLGESSRAKLLHLVPAQFSNISADHLTLNYGPSEDEVEKFAPMIGRRVTLTATAVVANDRVQAVKIKDIETKLGTPHVTISWANGAKPVESNGLVSADRGKPIQPWLKLEGVYDTSPSSIGET